MSRARTRRHRKARQVAAEFPASAEQLAGVRVGHLVVHRAIENGLPEPVATTVSVDPAGALHLRLSLAGQDAWLRWVELLDPGHEVHAVPAETRPHTDRYAVGRLGELRASVHVAVPSGIPLIPHAPAAVSSPRDGSGRAERVPPRSAGPRPTPGTPPGDRGGALPTTTTEETPCRTRSS